MMRDYLLTMLLAPDVSKGGIDELVGLVDKGLENTGKITKKAEWGKKRLSYPISKFNEGVYYCVEFSALASQAVRIERKVKSGEKVLRYLLTRKDN